MIRVSELLVTGIAILLLALGCLAAVGAAEAQELEVRVSFDSMAAGQSVVGAGVVHPLLTIGDSGGNAVLAIEESGSLAAYSAPFGQNIANGNIGTAQSARGFADVGGPPDYSYQTKKHRYVFTFAPGVAVSRFSVRMLDWGDFLPYGANADGRYAMLMTAFNASGDVVATDEIAFTSTDSTLFRTSPEYGDLRVSGDAATATDGKPGNVVLRVTAPGIVRVEVHARDQQSIDPHIGFNELQFALPDQDGDGVTDTDDQCPDSVTAADSPHIVVGARATSVPNADDVNGPGCGIQDLVNKVAAGAKNHGQLVVGIDDLAAWLVSVGAATPAQARELHQAAAHKHAVR